MNKGGPAFPQVDLKDHYGMLVPDRQAGMTLRDYFAAKALQTVMADAEAKRHLVQIGMGEKIPECLSQMAYLYADAMLKAREQ